jgi:UDP-N-acetylglucosamine--N-acetylmuramyl-(pentapeptide) pyrophosphoryl-undecaprenol N-acetylglucosamine transferase
MSNKIPKRFVLVGGGSGGHLTPLVAVAEAIKKIDSSYIVCHIGQRGENLSEVTHHPAIDESYEIRAGKFRRYHGESRIKQLLDIKTLLLNTRDLFRFGRGTLESFFLLRRLKPSAIFLKGGFVSVPVGYAARVIKIPYMTHDSDAIPGLANRMTAKHAVYNLTALPVENYPYSPDKAVQVGIPLQKEFIKISTSGMQQARKKLDIPLDAQVVLCVGGGLGAKKINDAIVDRSSELLTSYPKLIILHLTGKSLYDETKKSYDRALSVSQLLRIRTIDFSTTLYQLSAASDVIITRAGATNIAEFAAQSKPCIVIPAPHLTGGQQLHNAEILKNAQAALVVQEDSLESLSSAIQTLLSDVQMRKNISESLNQLAVTGADNRIARLLVEIAKD